MTTWVTFFVAIVIVHQISARLTLTPTEGNRSAPTSCYADQPDKYNFFSTKTSGFEIAERNTTPVSMPGCQPKSFWMIVRHGTRNPSDDAIREIANDGNKLAQEIVANHKAGRGKLCDADLDALSKWKWNVTEDQEKMLTDSGRREQRELGRRFRERFPGLLDQPFNKDDYLIRSTATPRAEKSAEAYGEGAFPSEAVEMEKPRDDDKVLRFYDHCPRWITTVDDNEETFLEKRQFQLGIEMETTKNEISKTLGFTSALPHSRVKLMYDMCRFKKAFEPEEVSPWCAAFSTENLKVWEYFQDLKYWYKNGYAYPINYNMACPLIKDMVDVFSENPRRGTFYFSHSEAVLPLMSLLGLNRDANPLRYLIKNHVITV